jgi:hypothetical protein
MDGEDNKQNMDLFGEELQDNPSEKKGGKMKRIRTSSAQTLPMTSLSSPRNKQALQLCTAPVGGRRHPRIATLNGIPHFTIKHKNWCDCTQFPPIPHDSIFTLHVCPKGWKTISHLTRGANFTGDLNLPLTTAIPLPPPKRDAATQTEI